MKSRSHASAVPFSTKLVTVADDSQFSTRRALHQLRVVRAEPPPPTPRDQAPDADDRTPRPPKNSLAAKAPRNVLASRRPANALVMLPEGQGHDPAALAQALKKMKNQLTASGVRRLMRADSYLLSCRPPSARRRAKARLAAARERKSVAQARQRDERDERMGR